MFVPRTDLAVEAHGINAERGVDDGMILSDSTLFGFPLCKAEILGERGERESGRKAGTYYTLDTGKLWLDSGDKRSDACQALSSVIGSLLPVGDAPILIAGLGNAEITADSVGPRVLSGLVVTHHIKTLDSKLYEELGLADVAAVSPNVLGQTGIEASVLIKAATDILRPRAVIAVDALAARSISRLGTTVQASNAGISPGSGVCNARAEISEGTLGVPVIAVGVPTVVDALTLVKEFGGEDCSCKNLFVTPKDSDLMVRVTAKLISSAINSALHGEGAEEYAPL